jgi:hypothetical protein
MTEIGKGAVEFCRRYEECAKENSRYHRTLSGILSLRKMYSDPVDDQACRRACYYGNITYRSVKKICEAGYESLPLPDVAPPAGQANAVVSLAVYREMVCLGVMN